MKKGLIILSICIMVTNITSFWQTVLSKNAVLIEKWTITVGEIHLGIYSEMYYFYDNGQFVFKRTNYSDISKIGMYHYQSETDMFFLSFSDIEYGNYSIQSVKEEHGQPDEMTVKYYEWKIDDFGNYNTENQIKSFCRTETLVRKKCKTIK